MEDKDMTIWQNHEQRISALEATVVGFSHKMDSLEKVVKDESKEQKTLLKRLIDHHLSTNKFKLSQFWKLVLNLTGAGSILGVFIYALVQFFNK